MDVETLIKELEKLPPEMLVWVNSNGNYRKIKSINRKNIYNEASCQIEI